MILVNWFLAVYLYIYRYIRGELIALGLWYQRHPEVVPVVLKAAPLLVPSSLPPLVFCAAERLAARIGRVENAYARLVQEGKQHWPDVQALRLELERLKAEFSAITSQEVK